MGLLSRLGRSPGVTPEVSGGDAGPDAVDAATAARMADAVGALVRLVGTFAHDTPGHGAGATRAEADAWRRRLAHEGALAGRDWEGAVRFATARRRAEHGYVERAHGELRDAVWVLVRGLHAVASQESTADGEGDAAVRRLADAVTSPDPEAVRDAARAAVAELGELAARRARLRTTEIRQLGQQLEALDAALDAARRDGATDALTGLGNRRALDEALARTHAAGGLWGRPVALVVCDLDGLKATNDGFGHQAGDDALGAVAAQLARTFLRRGDTLARHGGDEFAAVLPDTAVADAQRLAERAVAGVAEAAARLHARWAAESAATRRAPAPPFGLSAGVAVLGAGETVEAWVARADAALYAAKRAGKGAVRMADPAAGMDGA